MKRYEQRVAEYERGVLAEFRGDCGNGASDSGGYQKSSGCHRKGENRQSIQNCKYVLEHDSCLNGAICRNEMTCQIDIMKKMPWKRRGVHMTDTDMNNLALYLEKNYGLTSDRVITKAIDIVANENSFHPILEYLESLKWDGIPRIQYMLTHFFGAEDIDYTGEVMKMHMMGAIRRLYEPGAKYDIMLCLVGGQGTGKSTFFRYLAIKDEWFTDDMKRIDDKKVYEYLQGHWIVEMSERMRWQMPRVSKRRNHS